MNKGTVSVPDEQYERLAALAAARGVSPETQLARLIDDATGPRWRRGSGRNPPARRLRR